MNQFRESAQTKALTRWKEFGYKGTLELCTGFGKTYTAIRPASYFAGEANYNYRILILTPTTVIKEKVWAKEFKKWGFEDVYKKCVTIECIQTAFKWIGTHWDLVIADEMHNYLPDDDHKEYQFFKFFDHNTYDKILGLSAKIPIKKQKYLNKIAPIVYQVDLETALKYKIVSDFNIYAIRVSMNAESSSEYREIQRKYFYFERHLGGPFEAFRNATKYLEEKHPNMCSMALGFYSSMKKRKEFLYNLPEKVELSNVLMNHLQGKGILFAMSTNMADKIGERKDTVVYHSKQTKVVNEQSMRAFEKRKTVRYLASAEALNEGYDVPEVDYAIILAFTSSEKDMIQRIGRCVRKNGDKVANIFIFFCPGTQEEKWLRKATKSFSSELITYLNIEELWPRLSQKRTSD